MKNPRKATVEVKGSFVVMEFDCGDAENAKQYASELVRRGLRIKVAWANTEKQ